MLTRVVPAKLEDEEAEEELPTRESNPRRCCFFTELGGPYIARGLMDRHAYEGGGGAGRRRREESDGVKGNHVAPIDFTLSSPWKREAQKEKE